MFQHLSRLGAPDRLTEAAGQAAFLQATRLPAFGAPEEPAEASQRRRASFVWRNVHILDLIPQCWNLESLELRVGS